VKTDISDIELARELGEKIAKFVTERLHGLDLKFEKLFKRFLILAKKRYAAWSFENIGGVWKDKLEMKGIETVRRDWCNLTTGTMQTVLETILKEGDTTKAAKHVRNMIHDLNKGLIPLEDLTVVKGVTKALSSYDGIQPHVELAKKMMQRDPTKTDIVGERLGYVIIRGNQLLSKRAEDPNYVREKGLQIDSSYYVQNQMLPPIERIFEVCGISSTELIEGSRQKNLGDMFNKKESPEEIKLSGFDSIVCNKCHWEFRRPPLNGQCPKCNSQLYFSYNGNIGKSVELN
jgi:DNA polymerase I